MLIATLRVLGLFPCPTCLIPREHIHQLGTQVDKFRRARRRVDDPARQAKIEKTRRRIFESGTAVEAGRVKNILAHGSLLPINVSHIILGSSLY